MLLFLIRLRKKMTTEDQKDILELFNFLASLYQWTHIAKLLEIVTEVPVSNLTLNLLNKCDALVRKAIENNNTSSSVMSCAERLIALKMHANEGNFE